MIEENSVVELKRCVCEFAAPSLGRFGEKIYAGFMERNGFSIYPVHSQRIDFHVNGVGDVDVKTSGIGKRRANPVRINNINYCFIILNKEDIEIAHEDWTGRIIMPSYRISWAQAAEFYRDNRIHMENHETPVTAQNQKIKRELKEWIERNWDKKASVIFREGRSTQENMTTGARPWGPVNFHTKLNSRKIIDIKVLIYFDCGVVWRLLAYPINKIDEIVWYPSRLNSDHITFDPGVISRQFIFADIEDFRTNFLLRFPDA